MDLISALPSDVLGLIFEQLDALSLTIVLLVCKRWRNLALDDHFWYHLAVREKADFGLHDPAQCAKEFRTVTKIFDHVRSWRELAQCASRLNSNWSSGYTKPSRHHWTSKSGPSVTLYGVPPNIGIFRTKIDYIARKCYLSTGETVRGTRSLVPTYRGILGFNTDGGSLIVTSPFKHVKTHYSHLEGDNSYLVTLVRDADDAIAEEFPMKFVVFHHTGDFVKPLYSLRNVQGHAFRAFRVKKCRESTQLFTVDDNGWGTIVEVETARTLEVFKIGERPAYVDFDEKWAVSADYKRLWVYERDSLGGPKEVSNTWPLDDHTITACHIDGNQLIALESHGVLHWIADLSLLVKKPQLEGELRLTISFGVTCRALSFYRGRVAVEMWDMPIDKIDGVGSGLPATFDRAESLHSRFTREQDQDGDGHTFLFIFDTPSAPGRTGMPGLKSFIRDCHEDLRMTQPMRPSKHLDRTFSDEGPFRLIEHTRVDWSTTSGHSIHIDDTSVTIECAFSTHRERLTDRECLSVLDWSQSYEGISEVLLRPLK